MAFLIVGCFLYLKCHVLTDLYRMQDRFLRYTRFLLVLPLCVIDGKTCTKRCSYEGGITGRFQYLQVPHFRSSTCSFSS